MYGIMNVKIIMGLLILPPQTDRSKFSACFGVRSLNVNVTFILHGDSFCCVKYGRKI
jgi:hypothetical protein